MWDRQVPAFVDAGWRALAWDLRGGGQSPGPLDPALYTLAHCVDDLADLIAVNGGGPAVLVGHSLGGYVSLAFWLKHPELVRALVLVATGPGYRNEEGRAEWNTMVDRFTSAIDEKGLAALGDDAGMGYDRHASAPALALAGRGYLKQHDSRVIDVLGQIDLPTLVLVGAKDRAFVAPSKMMADKIPHSRLLVFPDAGHLVNLRQADQVNAAITGFLAGLEAPSA
jgi:pimeloyl-ACP methyl ester carboxylesterase